MIITLFLSLNFFLNIFLHGDVLVGVFNTTLLFLSVYFYLNLSARKLTSVKSPYIIFLGTLPIFTYHYDLLIIILALGGASLFLVYSLTKSKRVAAVEVFLYLILASFYISGLIKLPFLPNSELLIFFDDKINPYIPRMQKEALYLPFKIRNLFFGSSVYFYVLLSKTAGLFTLKNLYDLLLIANLYPLTLGLFWKIKSWDRLKTFFISCILLVSIFTSLTRAVSIFNIFVLLAPIILYFILQGFNLVNKRAYLILFVLSLIITTSPK